MRQSDCGETWLLNNLTMNRRYFDELYIIGHIVDQYEDLESVNEIADVAFIKDIKDLLSPYQIPKQLKKLTISDI